MAGRESGMFFVPDVNSEVVVAFEHGDISRPYVLGSVWNSVDKPPVVVDDKNSVRTIRSRSGNEIRLVDSPTAESISIVDKDGKTQFVMDMKRNTITISADADLTLESRSGKVAITGKQGVEITSGNTLKLSGTTAELKGSAKTTIKGGVVEIN